MLWPRFAQPQSQPMPPLSAQPVPDTALLRRTALQASWRRDRWVGRRRLVMRWVAWITRRYVLPTVVVMALAFSLWRWVTPFFAPSSGAHNTTLPSPSTSPSPSSNLSDLQLRADWQLTPVGTPMAPDVMADKSPPSPDTLTFPPLKPETWLHSQEP